MMNLCSLPGDRPERAWKEVWAQASGARVLPAQLAPSPQAEVFRVSGQTPSTGVEVRRVGSQSPSSTD